MSKQGLSPISEAKELTPIQNQLEQLMTNIIILDDRISLLRSQLAPVLSQEEDYPQEQKAPEPLLCDLGSCIRERRFIIQRLNSDIQDILNRLEV